jgi:hypothetical protein
VTVSVFHIETCADGSVRDEFVISPGRHSETDVERAALMLGMISDRDEPSPEEGEGSSENGECGSPPERQPGDRPWFHRSDSAVPEGGPENVKDTHAPSPSAIGKMLKLHTPAHRVPAKPPQVLAKCRGIKGQEHVLCNYRNISKVISCRFGGSFGVYNVDSEGYILPQAYLPDDRKMGPSRDKSFERFRKWADENMCSSVMIFDTAAKRDAK